jgi:8-oxo-dGTP pyrophosphatase MutT (NUDIX family)
MEITKEFLSTVYVVKDDKVLLTWNKKIEAWVPVGGHIEKNELPCDSVIREAKEESGLDIELINIGEKSPTVDLVQPLHIHVDDIKEDHKHINIVYLGKVIGGTLLEESDEGTPLKWFTKEEIEKEEIIPNVKEWAIKAINLF